MRQSLNLLRGWDTGFKLHFLAKLPIFKDNSTAKWLHDCLPLLSRDNRSALFGQRVTTFIACCIFTGASTIFHKDPPWGLFSLLYSAPVAHVSPHRLQDTSQAKAAFSSTAVAKAHGRLTKGSHWREHVQRSRARQEGLDQTRVSAYLSPSQRQWRK